MDPRSQAGAPGKTARAATVIVTAATRPGQASGQPHDHRSVR